MVRKTALVVGASGEIGAAVSEQLAGQGYAVFGTTTGLSNKILSKEVNWLELNLRTKRDVEAVVNSVGSDEDRPIDVLVYCAGIIRDGPMVSMPESDWHDVILANLTGAFWVAQATSRRMMLSGSGCMIFIGSISSRLGIRGQTNYTASKAGLEGLVRSISEELGPYGIRCNVVSAGPTQSRMMDGTADARRRTLMQQTPLRRFATPKDVANMVCFLASEAGGFITGQTINVDGGLVKL